MGVAKEECEKCAAGHKDDESNVSSIGDIFVADDGEVLSKGNQRSNDGTHVEDTPEPSEVATFLLFKRVRKHDGSLSSPKKTSTNTEKSSSKDIETCNVGMKRNK